MWRVRDTCKEENEEGPTLTGRWSAMARPSVFSGNNRKRNICARNATRSLPLSLPLRSPSFLSHLFLLYFILRSLLPVYPPRRRLVSVLPSLPLYWDAKREQCRSLNLFSVGNGWEAIGRRPLVTENDISYVILRYLILSNSKYTCLGNSVIKISN